MRQPVLHRPALHGPAPHGNWARAALVAVVLLAACAGDDAALRSPPAPSLDESSSGEFAWPPPSAASGARPPLPPLSGTDPGGPAGLPTPGDGADDTLYVIGGRRIDESDLGDFLLRYFPDRAREALAQLVDVVLVEDEAARAGVTVRDAEVRARAERYVEERRAELRVRGDETTLEELLASKYGRDIGTFRRDAERLGRVDLLRDRLVRFDALASPRVRVRVLVASTQAAAEGVAVRLRAGADPAALATSLGMARPVSPPPLARDEIRPEALAEAVFSAAPGAVLGPFPFRGDDGATWHQVVRLLERTEARAGAWLDVADEVERDIAARPVAVDEYLAWRGRALARRKVEVRRDAGGLVPWARGRPGDDESGGAW